MLLKSLPSELVDEVVGNVDTPRDLAALSAVCRYLKQIISPDDHLTPLRCCYLVVEVHNHVIFAQLAREPRLARCVRKLWLVDTRCRRMKGFWHEFRDVAEHSEPWNSYNLDGKGINAALLNMSRVESLALYSRIGLSPQSSYVLEGVRRACPLLVNMMLFVPPRAEPVTDPQAAIQQCEHFNQLVMCMSGCTRLTWSSHEGGPLAEASNRILRSIATRSPYLEHLCLNLYGIDYGMALCFFPHLRSFWLFGEHRTDYNNDIANFLHLHPALEYLHFPRKPGNLFNLHRDSLPNARRLNVSFDVGFWLIIIKPLSNGRYRPLEWLSIDTCTPVSREFCDHIARITTLTTLDMSCADVEQVSSIGSAARSVSTLCATPRWVDMDPDVRFLSSFPHLRRLKSSYVPLSIFDLEEAALAKLEEACPDLVCVDKWVRQPWKRDPGHKGWAAKGMKSLKKLRNMGGQDVEEEGFDTYSIWEASDKEEYGLRWPLIDDVLSYRDFFAGV